MTLPAVPAPPGPVSTEQLTEWVLLWSTTAARGWTRADEWAVLRLCRLRTAAQLSSGQRGRRRREEARLGLLGPLPADVVAALRPYADLGPLVAGGGELEATPGDPAGGTNSDRRQRRRNGRTT